MYIILSILLYLLILYKRKVVLPLTPGKGRINGSATVLHTRLEATSGDSMASERIDPNYHRIVGLINQPATTSISTHPVGVIVPGVIK